MQYTEWGVPSNIFWTMPNCINATNCTYDGWTFYPIDKNADIVITFPLYDSTNMGKGYSKHRIDLCISYWD